MRPFEMLRAGISTLSGSSHNCCVSTKSIPCFVSRNETLWLRVELQAVGARVALDPENPDFLEDDPLDEEDDMPVKHLTHRYPDRVLFVVTPSRRLVVVTADHAPDPKPGDTLISLVNAAPADPPTEAQPTGTGQG